MFEKIEEEELIEKKENNLLNRLFSVWYTKNYAYEDTRNSI